MRNRVTAAIGLLSGLLVLGPAASEAQSSASLRGKISQLFIFGSGEEALVLGGSVDPNNPASIQAHGHHFVPAAVAAPLAAGLSG